jgi:hypothetical protein
VAHQRLVDAVGADHQRAPLRTGELRADAARPEPGIAQRKRDDPLLDHRRELVGHLRAPTLTRTQHLNARALDHRLPAVVRRAVHPEGAARVRDRRARGQVEELQAIAEQHVILRHATRAPFTWR